MIYAAYASRINIALYSASRRPNQPTAINNKARTYKFKDRRSPLYSSSFFVCKYCKNREYIYFARCLPSIISIYIFPKKRSYFGSVRASRSHRFVSKHHHYFYHHSTADAKRGRDRENVYKCFHIKKRFSRVGLNTTGITTMYDIYYLVTIIACGVVAMTKGIPILI